MSLVAIVGRPNVGKSTLFNRLVEAREAIVHDLPGVTRDRHYGSVIWNGRTFDLVDTGGWVPDTDDRFESAIREQVRIAIQEADLLLFVVDVVAGITDLDDSVAELLRETRKPVIVVANKADNPERSWEAPVFYSLGLGDVFALSAINGTGTGDFLDAVVENLPEEPETADDNRPRIAFIGKPNVGKSSLTNALLGTNRSIVTEIGGTTRDTIDAVLQVGEQEVVLVDTAGLRKKAKVRENIEFYAYLRTERAIRDCDVAVLLVDAESGLETQDIRVLKEAEKLNKGLLIAINKWDLIEKETNTARDFERKIKDRLQTLSYVPAITISALTKKRIPKVLEQALQIVDERKKKVPTAQLNELLDAAVRAHHPPAYRNQYIKIKYATQVKQNPPVFAFFCNHPKGIDESYRRYLENRIRDAFGFEGVPVTVTFRRK